MILCKAKNGWIHGSDYIRFLDHELDFANCAWIEPKTISQGPRPYPTISREKGEE